VTAAALLWSAWVGVNGTVFRDALFPVCTQSNFNLEALCWYVPEFSVLINPFIKLKALSDWDKAGIALGAIVALALTIPMLFSRVRTVIADAQSARRG
jgi:hypothetical protein